MRGHIDALAAGDWEVLNESHFENAVAAPISRYRPEDGQHGRTAVDDPLSARRSA